MPSISALDRQLARLERGLAPPEHDGRAMSGTTSTSSRHSARSSSGRGMKAPLKSPLAMPSGAPVAPANYPSDIEGAVLASDVLSYRNATLAEFEDYLRTVNNRDGRPYEEKTISNYVGPGKNLDGRPPTARPARPPRPASPSAPDAGSRRSRTCSQDFAANERSYRPSK
jgi:hypothetical protein